MFVCMIKFCFMGTVFGFGVSHHGGLLAPLLGSVPLLSENTSVENHPVFRCKPKKCF